jgi:hypothetical protein
VTDHVPQRPTESAKPRRSLAATIFLSPSEPRLRAGWRLLLQVVLQALVLIIAGGLMFSVMLGVFGISPAADGTAGLLVSQVADLIAVTLSIFVARRVLDRRSFASLGLHITRQAGRDFAIGIVTTCLMMGSIFALEWGIGWLRVESFAWQTDSVGAVIRGVLLFTAICLLVGWKEELMSRGYHLQTIASGTSLAWGWIISSAVFGILHLANPHANLLSVAGIILAGMFLGYAYIRTGSLWLSMGLHTGWNFFEGVVFGFPVSGLPFYTLPRISIGGPVLWTGGEFGPEAGLVLIPALVIGFTLIHVYARDRSIASVP